MRMMIVAAAAMLLAVHAVAAQSDAAALRDAARAVEDRQADAWLASVEAQLRLTAA